MQGLTVLCQEIFRQYLFMLSMHSPLCHALFYINCESQLRVLTKKLLPQGYVIGLSHKSRIRQVILCMAGSAADCMYRFILWGQNAQHC